MPQNEEVRYVEKTYYDILGFRSNRRAYINNGGTIEIGLLPYFSTYLQQEQYRTTDCSWRPTRWKFQNIDKDQAHAIYLMNGKGYGGPIPKVSYR